MVGELLKRIEGLEKEISILKQSKQDIPRGLRCSHQTIPWGVHKRKCSKCGEIFIV